MQLTRRGWEVAGIVLVLVILAVLAHQPLALYAGAGVAAFGLAQQYSAIRALIKTDDALSITYTIAGHSAVVDESVQLTVLAELSEPCTTTIEITPTLPVAASTNESPGDTSESIHISPGDTTGQVTLACSFPVAGEFTVPAPTVHLTNRTGRVRETLTRGPQPTVVVEPRTPQRVHVGQGGDSVMAYGEHDAGQRGSGITPAELRKYVPGDAKRQIDWKATARLGEPHVREFEAETDRETVLIFDARSSMHTGRAGQRMLDYAREVALGLVALAERNTDPLGCYVVADTGLRTTATPSPSDRTYQRVRTALYDRTTADATPSGREGHATGSHSHQTADGRPPYPTTQSPSVSRRRLAGDDSTFARTLTPLFDTAVGKTHPAEDDVSSLRGAVERLHADRTGSRWTILLTADTDRDDVRAAVRQARTNGDQVFVFLTPSVLFDTDGLADVDHAYERYADFEQFRRSLDRLGGVTAFEVGPQDRLQAVLDAHRDRVSG